MTAQSPDEPAPAEPPADPAAEAPPEPAAEAPPDPAGELPPEPVVEPPPAPTPPAVPIDPGVAAAATATEAGVIGDIEEIVAWSREHESRIGYFAALYWHVATTLTEALKRGEF